MNMCHTRWKKQWVLFVLVFCLYSRGGHGETQHRTKAASEKQHDLWCYRCDMNVDGERCIDLKGNSTSLHTKCTNEQKKCQVRRISMSTSTDEITGKPNLWLLHRNCSENCEPGCIVIGERTKLHNCIECCDDKNFCNTGSKAGNKKVSKILYTFKILFTFYQFTMLNIFAIT